MEDDESPVEEDEPPVVPVEENEPPVVPVEEDEPPVVPVEEDEPPVVPVEEDEPPVVPVEEDEPSVAPVITLTSSSSSVGFLTYVDANNIIQGVTHLIIGARDKIVMDGKNSVWTRITDGNDLQKTGSRKQAR